MNDPVLNRKLFRHQAQIIHKQIPKLQQGGAPWYTNVQGLKGAWQAGPGRQLWDFQRGGGYNTAMLANPLKKGKFAWAAGKAGVKAAMPYVKKGLQKTGIARLFREASGQRPSYTGAAAHWAAKKAPKTYGATKVGVGGALGLYGGSEAYKGIKEGDYGRAAVGLGESLWGTGIVLRGGQLVASGMKGKEAFKKATKVKAKWKKSKADYGILPLFVGGALTAKDAEAEPGVVLSETEKEEFYQILKTVSKDIENYTEQELNKAIEIFEKQKISKKPDNLGDTGNIGEKEMLTDEIVPDAGGSTSGESSEILAKQKEMNAQTQAEVLKNRFNESDMATQREFLKFRQSITDLTGTYGNDRDLILMKLASGMMSGKTAHTGLKGFMDVTGKAMGPTVDTALALSNAQKGRDTDLATAFLKMKAEQAEADAEGGGTTLKGVQERFIVRDPSAPYGYKVVFGQYDKDTGQIMEHIGNQQYQVMQGEPVNIKVSQAQLQKSRIRVSSSAQAHDMAAWVEQYMQDNLKGITGNVKLKLADWFALSNTVTGGSNKYTQGLESETFINSEIFSQDNLSDDMVGLPGFKRSEGDLIKEQYYKEQRQIKEDWATHANNEGWDVSDSELAQLTKAALIENRLKYLVANANKQADRLTRYDINNAEKSTAILPFANFSTGFTARTVNEKMRALQFEMKASFDRSARQYQQLGGTNDYLLDFNTMPYIREILDLQSQAEMDQAKVTDVLETIPIPGVGG